MRLKGNGLLLVLSIWCLGCDRPAPEELLVQYFEQQIGISPDKWPKAIFVISEDGCPACNRAFANMVRPRTTVPQCLFLVRAQGVVVDLNGFLQETDQVRFDDGSFKQLGLLKGSGMILLNGNKVDTIINLDATEIGKQLMAMTALLDSLGGSSINAVR